MIKAIYLTGILAAFSAIAMGAWGAHGLSVDAIDLSRWEKAVTYQFYHALGLILFGLWREMAKSKSFIPAICFTLGVLLFSGSLYALVLTQNTFFAQITPKGGMLFLIGWMIWGVAVVRKS